VFVLFAVPHAASMLHRAQCWGERAGKDCKYEVWLEHSHGRTACTLANASESVQLRTEKALGTLEDVMAFLMVLGVLCSPSAPVLPSSSVCQWQMVLTLPAWVFPLFHRRELCGIGF